MTRVDPYPGSTAHWALFDTLSRGDAVDMAYAHPMGDLKDGHLNVHAMVSHNGVYEG